MELRGMYVCIRLRRETGREVRWDPATLVLSARELVLRALVRRDPETGGGPMVLSGLVWRIWGEGLRYPFHFRFSSVGSVSVELQVSHQFSERAGWSQVVDPSRMALPQ